MEKDIKVKENQQMSTNEEIVKATEILGDLTVDGQIRAKGQGGVGAINPNDEDATAYLGFSGEGDETVARIRLRGDGEGADGPFQIQERGDRVRMSVETDRTTINGILGVKGEVRAPQFSGDLSGNAATASTLQTSRKINGVSFDGSENISLPEQMNIAGNAATATRLQNARRINNVNFDGTSNIMITANPNAHTHNAIDINSGTFHVDRIPNLPIGRINNLQSHIDDSARHVTLTPLNAHNVNSLPEVYNFGYSIMHISPSIAHGFPTYGGTVETIRTSNGLTTQRVYGTTPVEPWVRIAWLNNWTAWRQPTTGRTFAVCLDEKVHADSNDLAEYMYSKLTDKEKDDFTEFVKEKREKEKEESREGE